MLNLLLDLDPDFHIIGKRYINVLQVCCHLVAMSSTCYNPFIYASLHSKVRMHLKGYLCSCHGTQARDTGDADVHGGTLISHCASRHTATYLGMVSKAPGPKHGTDLTVVVPLANEAQVMSVLHTDVTRSSEG